ncbi:hypothetical protein LX36DRAFT_116301 [Colletotrichum falcatum]|nr:hypothetical protein LX36DRAFT_116301 [Colletotrichum falcatum]
MPIWLPSPGRKLVQPVLAVNTRQLSYLEPTSLVCFVSPCRKVSKCCFEPAHSLHNKHRQAIRRAPTPRSPALLKPSSQIVPSYLGTDTDTYIHDPRPTLAPLSCRSFFTFATTLHQCPQLPVAAKGWTLLCRLTSARLSRRGCKELAHILQRVVAKCLSRFLNRESHCCRCNFQSTARYAGTQLSHADQQRGHDHRSRVVPALVSRLARLGP